MAIRIRSLRRKRIKIGGGKEEGGRETATGGGGVREMGERKRQWGGGAEVEV